MPQSLADDLLTGVPAIAKYVGVSVRRTRLLIDFHNLPIKRDGFRIISRKSWIDAHYAEPDKPTNGKG